MWVSLTIYDTETTILVLKSSISAYRATGGDYGAAATLYVSGITLVCRETVDEITALLQAQ